MISATTVKDSKIRNSRLITMKLVFPRYILAELNTHRVFSKNSASSRAIPFSKMVKSVQENPFIPIAWQKDHKGMQGTEYLIHTEANVEDWLKARDYAVEFAENLNNGGEGVSKQMCNRLLEPFLYHTVLLSSTEWENFFKLRCPQYHYYHPNEGDQYYRSRKDWEKAVIDSGVMDEVPETTEIDWLTINKGQADIHMMALAEAMWDAYNESEPEELEPGQWHIPFGDQIDEIKLSEFMPVVQPASLTWYMQAMEQLKVKIASARCARISYQTLGDDPQINYEADLKLHDILSASGHWSPFEHCAQAKGDDMKYGNFTNFKQYRQILEK